MLRAQYKKTGKAKKAKAKNSTSKEGTAKICACCAQVQPSMQQCARCKVVNYCCRDCQVQHWHQHKKACDQNCKVGAPLGIISSAGANKEHAQHEEARKTKAFVARALENEECSICLELVTDESNFQLMCGHWYHT